MMKAFAPYFFDVINHQENAKEICKVTILVKALFKYSQCSPSLFQSIDICFTPGNVHLLGGHKCTFGPSYWCHTAAHADACNVSFEKIANILFPANPFSLSAGP